MESKKTVEDTTEEEVKETCAEDVLPEDNPKQKREIMCKKLRFPKMNLK